MFGQLLDEPDCLRAVRDGTGSSEGKTAKGRRLSVEELAQRWPVAFPAMQQMRSVIHESGGQRVLRGDGQHSPPPVLRSEPG